MERQPLIIDKGLNAGERVVVDGTQKRRARRPVLAGGAGGAAAAPESTSKLGASR
jgi:hypothetical protein